MKQQIWKYEIATTDWQHIEMPKNAKILCVQIQNRMPCIWAMGDTEEELINRKIVVIGTGHDVPDYEELIYIGTYQLDDGRLVFHVFERVSK